MPLAGLHPPADFRRSWHLEGRGLRPAHKRQTLDGSNCSQVWLSRWCVHAGSHGSRRRCQKGTLRRGCCLRGRDGRARCCGERPRDGIAHSERRWFSARRISFGFTFRGLRKETENDGRSDDGSNDRKIVTGVERQQKHRPETRGSSNKSNGSSRSSSSKTSEGSTPTPRAGRAWEIC
ncbi:unnamed protein product, partial [Ectocarpus sp. 12 AP-2014]